MSGRDEKRREQASEPLAQPRHFFATVGLATAAVLAGCSREAMVPTASIIETTLPGYGVSLSVPETVESGSRFEVAFQTYGGGCHRAGDSEDLEVHRDGDRLTLQPWDFQQTSFDSPLSVNCADVLRVFRRQASVTFETPGPKVVRLRGWSEAQGRTITVSTSILVE